MTINFKMFHDSSDSLTPFSCESRACMSLTGRNSWPAELELPRLATLRFEFDKSWEHCSTPRYAQTDQRRGAQCLWLAIAASLLHMKRLAPGRPFSPSYARRLVEVQAALVPSEPGASGLAVLSAKVHSKHVRTSGLVRTCRRAWIESSKGSFHWVLRSYVIRCRNLQDGTVKP